MHSIFILCQTSMPCGEVGVPSKTTLKESVQNAELSSEKTVQWSTIHIYKTYFFQFHCSITFRSTHVSF